MTLIAAALVLRKNARLYQLATSAINPVNMGRSIELTGLAHRKHYKTQTRPGPVAESKAGNHPGFKTAI